MSITSAQITERLKRSPNVEADKQKLFENARYFVAQEPASNQFSDTIEGYYKGKKVFPGPKANPKIAPRLTVTDVRLAETLHFIRFVDSQTTEGADDSVGRALVTIMSPQEADEYEATVAKLKGISLRGEPQPMNNG